MSIYDKSLKSVADAAAKIMGEALKGNQHKIDVAEPKGKITGADFQKLRTMKKEEAEQIDELSKKTLSSYTDKVIDKTRTMPQDAKKEKHMTGLMTAANKQLVKKEEVELQEMSDMIDALIQEYESKGGVYKHKGTYGTAKGAEYGETDYDKENEMEKKKDKPARKAYGARQNYVRSTRVNEGFTELLATYQEGGVKALNESLYIVEEADNDQFHAEVEENKKKAEGKVKQPEVAKGAVKAVAITKEEVDLDEANTETKKEFMDRQKRLADAGEKTAQDPARLARLSRIPGYTDAMNIAKKYSAKTTTKEEVEQVEERTMTEPEMKEREKIVKGMKKGIAGFKQRYGERAKSVMYATATKQAMKD